MATQIDKERKKKAQKKQWVIIGGVAYLYAALTYLHYSVITAADGRISSTDALNKASTNVFVDPLAITKATSDDLFILLAVSALIFTGLFMFMSDKEMRKHDNPETVNGDARFMTIEDLKRYNLRFTSPYGAPGRNGTDNILFSKEMSLGLDNRATRRNANVFVAGGSGTGKSWAFAGPNILQMNANFIVTDPSGDLLKQYGKVLENNGYEIKTFNLVEVFKSNRYNPFYYIRSEKDILVFVNALIKNTSGSDDPKREDFWEKCEKLFIQSCMLYMWHMLPKEQHKLETLLALMDKAEIDEEGSTESDLDLLFKDMAEMDPKNLAVKYYRKFKKAAGKTLKSILISVSVRMQFFELADIAYLTSDDDFHLESFADTKQAIFVIIPTADDTFNFIVSLLYSQIFMTLYQYCETTSMYGWKVCIEDEQGKEVIKAYQATNDKESKTAEKTAKALLKLIRKGCVIEYDKTRKIHCIYTKDKHVLLSWRGTKEAAEAYIERIQNAKVLPYGEMCANHVRFILDEFANISQIPQFDKRISTIRKYNISVNVIVQALAQIKELYDKKAGTIIGNCDTILYLGTNDEETNKWISEKLDKRTTKNANLSLQDIGGGSTSYNVGQNDLMTQGQLGRMDDKDCIVIVRGNFPYYGKKYDITTHPKYHEVVETKGSLYRKVSDEAKTISALPLRERLLAKQDTAPVAEENSPTPEEKKEVKKVKEKKKNPITDEHERSVRNNARKEEAKEIAKTLANYDEANDPLSEAQSMIISSFMSDRGLAPQSSDTQIKESAESFVELMAIQNEKISYGNT